MKLLTILDYTTSILTVTSLFLAGRYNWGWLLYSANCLLFSYVVYNKKLKGLTLMGICLFFVGLANYF